MTLQSRIDGFIEQRPLLKNIRAKHDQRKMDRAIQYGGSISHIIFRQVLPREKLLSIFGRLVATHNSRKIKAQSGFCITETPDLIGIVRAPIEQISGMYLMPEKSSFRMQYFDQPLTALASHQDLSAIGTKHGMTYWCPMTDLDDETPTLAIHPFRYDKYFHHHGDDAGYSILSSKFKGNMWPLKNLRVGDMVQLWPDTIHATYIPHDARRHRCSLDIRVRP